MGIFCSVRLGSPEPTDSAKRVSPWPLSWPASSSGSACGTGITAIARSSIKNLPGDLPGRAYQGNFANSPSGEINTVLAPAKSASSGCQTRCRNVAAACSDFWPRPKPARHASTAPSISALGPRSIHATA